MIKAICFDADVSFLFFFILARRWRPAPYDASLDKCPVICLGNGSFDRVRFRGKSYGHVKLLRRKLQDAQHQGRLIVLDVDERYTSKTCSTCGRRALANAKVFLPFEKVYALHAVVYCNKCNRVWQRDTNAARNIRSIAILAVQRNNLPAVHQKSNPSSRPVVFTKSYDDS